MLVRTVTKNTARDAVWGNYVQMILYCGQCLAIWKDPGIESVRCLLRAERKCTVMAEQLAEEVIASKPPSVSESALGTVAAEHALLKMLAEEVGTKSLPTYMFVAE